jgi:uncharacterized protein (DUF952 family)/mannose-6-phosphate isomerase-like protein (cupin superfamily)
MPKLIGKSVRVVDHEGLTIDEYVGNVSTKDDSVSVAYVNVTNPTAEPWLTLDYEEWLCVLKGKMELHTPGSDEVVTVTAGETAFIEKGEKFRPVFPDGNTTYVPICRPAFTPERCVRDEEGVSDVSKKLKELHANNENEDNQTTTTDKSQVDSIDKLYHMCQVQLWESAKSEGKAYFPPTFVKDGMFTHATAVAPRLLNTANHFYTATVGDWICVELSRSALLKIGIDTVFEEAKPVGETSVGETWSSWVCPHIYGGIPAHIDGIVTNVYKIQRDEDGKFLAIEGLPK